MLVLTSWDDGHPLDMRVAELLSRYGLQGTFFVPIRNREGRQVMQNELLRELGRDFEIGGHTLTHRYPDGVGDEELAYEIFEGKRVLEDQLGRTVTGFCYVGGRFNAQVTHLVRTAGFTYARPVENLSFSLGHDRWRVPTTLQFYPHGFPVLVPNVSDTPLLLNCRSCGSALPHGISPDSR